MVEAGNQEIRLNRRRNIKKGKEEEKRKEKK